MRTRLLAATTAAATALTLAPFAAADPAPVTGVELNQPADQVIAVEAKFNLTSDQEIAMRELRKLRGDMWDRNVPFDGTTLRQAAANHGLTTKEQYVNAVQLDPGYQSIALQRAVEAAKKFEHVRPFNSTCYGNCGKEDSATINGKGPYGQVLSTRGDMAGAMQAWGYDEVAALYRLNGAWSADQRNLTGHLHSLINPRVTYVGFAAVTTTEGRASAGSVGFTPTGATSYPAGQRTEVLHRPADGNERPNTNARKLTADVAPAEPSKVETIVGIVLVILGLLAAIFSKVQPQLQKFRHLV